MSYTKQQAIEMIKRLQGFDRKAPVVIVCPDNMPIEWAMESYLAFKEPRRYEFEYGGQTRTITIPQVVPIQADSLRKVRAAFDLAERWGGEDRVVFLVVSLYWLRAMEGIYGAPYPQRVYSRLYPNRPPGEDNPLLIQQYARDPHLVNPITNSRGPISIDHARSDSIARKVTGREFIGYDSEQRADGLTYKTPVYRDIVSHIGGPQDRRKYDQRPVRTGYVAWTRARRHKTGVKPINGGGGIYKWDYDGGNGVVTWDTFEYELPARYGVHPVFYQTTSKFSKPNATPEVEASTAMRVAYESEETAYYARDTRVTRGEDGNLVVSIASHPKEVPPDIWEGSLDPNKSTGTVTRKRFKFALNQTHSVRYKVIQRETKNGYAIDVRIYEHDPAYPSSPGEEHTLYGYKPYTTRPQKILRRDINGVVSKMRYVNNNKPSGDNWIDAQGVRLYQEDPVYAQLNRDMKARVDSLKANGRLDDSFSPYDYTYKLWGGNPRLDEALLTLDVTSYNIKREGRKEYRPQVLRNPQYAVGEWIVRWAKKNKRQIPFLAIDEAHRINGLDSLQGILAGRMLNVAWARQGMTGTLSQGYASSMLRWYRSLVPALRAEFPETADGTRRFIERHGAYEEVYETGTRVEKGRTVSFERELNSSKGGEAPGISDDLTRISLPVSTQMVLPDLGAGELAGFQEVDVPIYMGKKMLAWHNHLFDKMRGYVSSSNANGDRSPNGSFGHMGYRLPDAAYGEQLFSYYTTGQRRGRKTEKFLNKPFHPFKPINDNPSVPLPKEAKMIEIVQDALAKGDRTIIYTRYTGAEWDIRGRYRDLLKANCPGAKPYIIPGGVKPKDRKEHIEKVVREQDVNVLIVNPVKVQEGVSLLDFNVIIFMTIEGSLSVMVQSSKRTRRIPQEKDTLVYYLFYIENIFQNRTMFNFADRYYVTKMHYGDAVDNEEEITRLVAEDGVASRMADLFSDDFASREEISKRFLALNETFGMNEYIRSQWYPVQGLPKDPDMAQFLMKKRAEAMRGFTESR